MQKLKQGPAAIALVATLGLVAPSTFGGSASADISPHNRNSVESTFKCDLNGDAGDGDAGDGYETAFELVSTFNSTMWQDKNSSLVVVQRLQVDVLESDYVPFRDPTGTAVAFHDATADWWFTPQSYPQGTGQGQGNGKGNGKGQGQGKPQGWKTVPCLETNTYLYAPYPSDVALNDEFGLEFVQNTREDSTPGFCPDEAPVARESLRECVTYTETDIVLYDVTLSPGGQQFRAASAGDAPSADRAHSGKHKHRGKGKRGR